MWSNNLSRDYLRLLSKMLLLRLFTLVFTDIVNIVFSIQLGYLTDVALQQSDLSNENILVSLLLFLLVIFLNPILLYFSNKMLLKKSLETDQFLFHKVLNQNPQKIESFDSGELSRRIQDDGIAYRWALIDLVCYGGEVFFLWLAMVCLCIQYSFVYTIFVAGLVILGWILSYALAKKSAEWEQRKRNADEQIYHRFMGCFQNYTESKINGYLHMQYDHLADTLEDMDQSAYLPRREIELVNHFYQAFYQRFSYFAMIAFGMYLVMNKGTSIGLIVMMTYLYVILAKALEHANDILAALRMKKHMEQRIDQYTDELCFPQEGTFSTLIVDKLHFAYENGKTCDYDHIDIKCGDKLAIIGENGSGKSTLLKIISGIYPVKSGMMLNQMPYDKALMRSLISYIDVEAIMFNDTTEHYLKANITKANPSISNGTDFHIDHLLKQDTAHLSGGERKRVDLCRVISESKDIIIIDEPEAFLDEDGKKLFLQAMKSCPKTFIYTTHDKEFLTVATKVIMVEKQDQIA